MTAPRGEAVPGRDTPSVLLFGDTGGLPPLLRILDPASIKGLVRAEIRPEQEEELSEVAGERGLPIIAQPRVASPSYGGFSRQVRDLDPDLIVVHSYSMLLRPDVLSVPRLGAFNVHFALLPRNRGPNPIQWAILGGERETGVTIHEVVERVDAGPIVCQERVPIHFQDTWVDVSGRLDAVAEDLLREILPRLLEGSAERHPQDEAAATVNRRRTPEDGRIDWDAPVRKIYDLVRALVAPLPGAFYERSGGRTVIDRPHGIAEIAALKYDGPGGRELSQGGLRLRPVPEPGGTIRLAVQDAAAGARLGAAEIEPDWDRDSYSIALEVPEENRGPAERLARRFASEELLLVSA